MTTINRFRQDNTEGYSDAELAELNLRFERAVIDCSADTEDKSYLDKIAETILATFDDER